MYFIEKRSALKQMCVKVVSGDNYVNPKDYEYDGKLCPGRYTLEMFSKFYEQCKSCTCIDKPLCQMKCVDCFNKLFNVVDERFFKFALEKNIQNDFGRSDEKSVENLYEIHKHFKHKCTIETASDETVEYLHYEIVDAINKEILKNIL